MKLYYLNVIKFYSSHNRILYWEQNGLKFYWRMNLESHLEDTSERTRLLWSLEVCNADQK